MFKKPYSLHVFSSMAEAEIVEQHHFRGYEPGVKESQGAGNWFLVFSAVAGNQCLVSKHTDFVARVAID